jgi:hypothetical protein
MPSISRAVVPGQFLRPKAADAGLGRSWSRRSVLLGCAAMATLLVASPPPAKAQPNIGQWDPSLPSVLSAGAPGDPLAIANASLQASAYAAQTTMDLGRKFLGSLGIVSPTANPGPTLSGNRVYGKQAIEYVIRRAGSQIGVPYSWGGGSLTGPSRGIDSGANTVGFDCSGLTRYAFAGVGVQLTVRRGPESSAVASQTRRPVVLGSWRWSTRSPLSRGRKDARSTTNWCAR